MSAKSLRSKTTRPRVSADRYNRSCDHRASDGHDATAVNAGVSVRGRAMNCVSQRFARRHCRFRRSSYWLPTADRTAALLGREDRLEVPGLRVNRREAQQDAGAGAFGGEPRPALFAEVTRSDLLPGLLRAVQGQDRLF